MTSNPSEQETPPPSGVHVGRISLVAIGILVMLAASLAAMTGFYFWQAPQRAFAPPHAFPGPRVSQDEKLELAELLATQRRRLEAKDEATGMAIEKAMELIAGRQGDAYAPVGQSAPNETPQAAPPPQPQPSAAAAQSNPPAVHAEKRGARLEQRSGPLRHRKRTTKSRRRFR